MHRRLPFVIERTADAQHLRVLEDSRLIRTAKVGRVRTCAIEPAGFSRLEQWIGWHRGLWEDRFDRLGDVLDED